jgi:hypothetical protein
MRRLSLLFIAPITAALAVLAVACNNPTSRLPTTPSPPGFAGLQISGPSSIAPGQSAQYTALVSLQDGTTKSSSPATALRWTAGNSLLQVNAAGVATAGQQLGDATILAIIGGGGNSGFGTKEVVVVPDGTYRMVGIVSEVGDPDIRVPGARVTVSPGSLVTTTDFEGRYRLYGVPANATVQVTKEGYLPSSESVQLSAHATRDFSLDLTGTRLSLNGPYTLVIDISGRCSNAGPLSPALQRRSYEAVLTQVGATVEVTLTEPRFRLNTIGGGGRFGGRVDAGGASFLLPDYDPYYYPYYAPSYYPGIAERLSDGSFLVIQGSAVTTGSAAGLSGEMDGSLSNWDSRFPRGDLSPRASCVSATARFTLTPR